VRYLVTGGTGFIGRRLTAQLLAAGHEVRILARTPEKAASLARMGAEVRRGDVADRDSVQTAMAGTDGVFHLAAWNEIGRPDRRLAERVNVEGARCVFETMRALGLAKGVFTSTLAVHPPTLGRAVDETERPSGPWSGDYARTKWRAHYEVAELLARAGVPLAIVLPGVVYGPGDPGPLGTTLRRYLRGRLLMRPRGARYSLAHVDDVARGHMLAMTHGRTGEAYLLAGPEHTLEEFFRSAEGITGIPVPPFGVPPGLLRGVARLMDVVNSIIPLPAAASGEALRMAAGASYVGRSDKARRELGWTARPLETGLRQTIAAERSFSTSGRGADRRKELIESGDIV
jgi:nucleoside-diphosphate-sugar epimerase